MVIFMAFSGGLNERQGAGRGMPRPKAEGPACWRNPGLEGLTVLRSMRAAVSVQLCPGQGTIVVKPHGLVAK
jgi:hypothetical protein